jgi:alkylation response protein AidB-like acyl-CoA dehydrogenase
MSTARKVPGGWQLNGDKHFITGADGAGFAIVMAKSEGQGAPEGASMFLVEADKPGWQVGNRMRTIDEGTVGGHCQVRLREALLWQVAGQVMQGVKDTEESSRAEVSISEATGRIVDRAVQLAGGAGVTEELVIGRIYADIRAFRIYDGPLEAHRASIARRAVARIQRASA